jgi:hypothetical protein
MDRVRQRSAISTQAMSTGRHSSADAVNDIFAAVGIPHDTSERFPDFGHIWGTHVQKAHRRTRVVARGAAVDGILDDSVDGGVVWTPPNRLAILALHRQIEIVLVEPEQRLPGAARFQDFVEDQSDGLLYAAVRQPSRSPPVR